MTFGLPDDFFLDVNDQNKPAPDVDQLSKDEQTLLSPGGFDALLIAYLEHKSKEPTEDAT